MSVEAVGRRAFAPGRVNLIGDHTDYNAGLALPMGIQLGVEVEYHPDDRAVLVVETDLDPSPAAIPLSGPPGALASWGALAAAVVEQVRPALGGRVVARSDLPVGAGLSSSAAFSVALALALGATPDPLRLARLCQRAELAVGVPVGLMDPLVVMAARSGRALLVDFDTLRSDQVPVPEDAVVTVVDSGTARRLDTTAYATRRAECEAAAAVMGRPLGRASPEDADRVADPVLRRRARHVTTETARVRAFARALERRDLVEAGRLMTESHRSLAEDFEVSTAALDELVERLCSTPGVFGARLTGAGFGGCVVALSAAPFDPGAQRAWEVRASAGARVEPR